MSPSAIVIGSGFGGAVAACRLSEAGFRVIVMERGRRWTPADFPRRPEDPWIWDHRSPETHNGWFDLRAFPGMTVAQGAGVGGGSLVYANVSCEAPPTSFETGWPSSVTRGSLQKAYAVVGEMLEVETVPPGQWTDRMRLVQAAANAKGDEARFAPLPLAVRFDPDWHYDTHWGREKRPDAKPNRHGAVQGTCEHLGNCDIGCEVNARNTLDLNYLFVAEKNGAQIRPMHLVTSLEELPERGYRVGFRDLLHRQSGTEIVDRVFVCAGSLGSTELLLQNRNVRLPRISARLGQGWSSNGDFLTPAIHAFQPVNADRGPTIASAINYHDGSNKGQRFWIQDGGSPNLLTAYVDRKIADPATSWRARLTLTQLRNLAQGANPLKHLMPWFAQGVDASDGRLFLRPADGGGSELALDWNPKKSEALFAEIIAMHKKLALLTGGVALVPPTWSLFRDLITPHPLGGCNMGASADDGVVNDVGEVFGYKNLYVLDGAIVPRAIGVNPSRTIAALAERAMNKILNHAT